MGSVGAWLGACARIPFVVGIDRFLPAALGRIHPRYGSPATALIAQALIASVFVFLGQGGTSVKGAYEVMVSTTVIVTLLPFLFLFAAAFRFCAERPSEGMIRIPGGRYTVAVAAVVGAFTTLAAVVLAVVPADDEPNKVLAVAKVLGMTAVMVGSGVAVYAYAGRHERRARRTLARKAP
jgi:amino acid transporter